MNRKRRVKKYRPSYHGRKMQVNFLPVIVIIGLSVFAGYLTAKYVLTPILGYEPAGLTIFSQKEKELASAEKIQREKAKESSVILEDGADVQKAETDESNTKSKKDDLEAKTEKTMGYALQFGSYSTKAAAEKSVKQLEESGIEAQIKEKDGHYKVIGPLCDTKEEAKLELDQLDETVAAFVTEMEE